MRLRRGGQPDDAWPETRQESGPPTLNPPGAEPVPAPQGPLAGDMARLFRVLGLHSFRASVVDMASMAYESAWLIGEDGEVVDEPDRAPLDSAFPGSMQVISRLANAGLEETLEQPLGARRCIYAWRMDGLRVVIAEARYHERQDRTRDLDIAAARLVCSAGLIGRNGQPRTGPDSAPLHWRQESQPVRPPAVGRSLVVTSLGLALASAALAGWLGLQALPATQAELQAATAQSTRLRGMTDATLANALTTALASGDYGEVQNQLGNFESLGYFRGALITNARERVVAMAGQVDDSLRIGTELPAQALARAQSRELGTGTERFGRLVIVKPASFGGLTPPDIAGMRTVAGVAAGAAALGALLLAWAARRRG